MRAFCTFAWRGEPIADIRVWAEQRGEPMIPFLAERKVPNLLTGELDYEMYKGEMPQSFWDTLLMADGWQYTRVE